MSDFLAKLISDARKRIEADYYSVSSIIDHKPFSLSRALRSASGNAIIAEIKPISPARGPLRPGIDAETAATELERGGAAGLSILTEPDNFGGSLQNLQRVRRRVGIPILMKDIVIDKAQIKAAKQSGADCVLLIEAIFSKHLLGSIDELLQFAHDIQLEVLLEVNDREELGRALESEADIIGINNRNLETLEIDPLTTSRLLEDREVLNTWRELFNTKPIISESGFETSADIRKLKQVVDGFLVGSSIMLSADLESKVRELVLA